MLGKKLLGYIEAACLTGLYNLISSGVEELHEFYTSLDYQVLAKNTSGENMLDFLELCAAVIIYFPQK